MDVRNKIFDFVKYLFNCEDPYDYVDDEEKLKELIRTWLGGAQRMPKNANYVHVDTCNGIHEYIKVEMTTTDYTGIVKTFYQCKKCGKLFNSEQNGEVIATQ